MQLSETTKRLDGVIDGIKLNPLTPNELFEVSQTLRGSEDLRRSLASEQTPVAEREAVVRSLFESRLSAESVEVLLAAVRENWGSERELSQAIDRQAMRTQLMLTQSALARTDGDDAAALDALLAEHPDLAEGLHARTLAKVTVARPMSDEQAAKLRAELGRIYGKEVDLDFIIDERILGGARVEIDGELIDGTIASRLEDARRRLASGASG